MKLYRFTPVEVKVIASLLALVLVIGIIAAIGLNPNIINPSAMAGLDKVDIGSADAGKITGAASNEIQEDIAQNSVSAGQAPSDDSAEGSASQNTTSGNTGANMGGGSSGSGVGNQQAVETQKTPEEKIDSALMQEIAQAQEQSADAMVQVIIQINSESDLQRIAELAGSEGGINAENYAIGNLVVVQLPANKVIELASDGSVLNLFADREVEAIEETAQENLGQINAQYAWERGYDGSGVKIAILDTGINAEHEMLLGKVIAGASFVDTNDVSDKQGHGTHVAGIAAGSKANGALYGGVAPNALLLNGKVLNDSGIGSTATVIAGINWAVENGANVINLSLGARYSNPSDPINLAIKEAVEKGIIVVAAAGNCGPCGNCSGFSGVGVPGDSAYAITVGAVQSNNEIACFSSGSEIAGVGIKPDVSAPGVDIISGAVSGYATKSGTSMATPHVSGAIALLLQANPNLTAAKAKEFIESNAVDLGAVGKDIQYGSGLIDLNRIRIIVSDTNNVDSNRQIDENKIIDNNLTNAAVSFSPPGSINKDQNYNFGATYNNASGQAVDSTLEFIVKDIFEEVIERVPVGPEYIEAGASQTFSFSWGTGEVGAYYIGVDAYINGALESSQQSGFSVTIPEIARIDSFNINPASIQKGSNASYSLQLSNIGAIGFDAVLELEFINDANGISDIIVSDAKGLAPGQSAVFDVSDVMELYSGNYDVNAIVHYGDKIASTEKGIAVYMPATLSVSSINALSEVAIDDNLNITITLSNSGNVATSPLLIAALVDGNDAAAAATYAGEEIGANSSRNYELSISASNLEAKEYGLLVRVEYEGNEISQEKQAIVIDNRAPEIAMYSYSNSLTQNSFNSINALVDEDSNLLSVAIAINSPSGNYTGAMAPNYAEDGNLVWGYAFEETGLVGNYSFSINACDVFNNCRTSGAYAFSISAKDPACASRNILLVNDDLGISAGGSDSIYALGNALSGYCTIDWQTSANGIPSLPYMQKFNAVVWSLGNHYAPAVDGNEAQLLIAYAEQGGRLLIEGSEIAFMHTGDELSEKVLHSYLYQDIDGNALSELTINKGIAHPITKAFGASIAFDLSNNLYPDALAAGDGNSLLEYSAGGSALVIYNGLRGNGSKIVFVPFAISALQGGDAGNLIAGSITWLLENADAADLEIDSIDYAPEYAVESEPLNVSVAVGNSGTASAGAELQILVDGVVQNVQNVSVNAGSNANAGAGITLAKGLHEISAVVNPAFSVREIEYLNNSRTIEVDVKERKADLNVISISYSPEMPALNDNVAITAQIRNEGGLDAGNALVEILVNGNVVKSETISVGRGTTVQVIADYASNPSGINSIAVNVDPEGKISEITKANNMLTQELYVCDNVKVIIVEDNDANNYAGENAGSAEEIIRILKKQLYCYSAWSEKDKGVPTAGDLKAYNVVIWSAGNYWNSTMGAEDQALLGALNKSVLIEGSDILFDNSAEDMSGIINAGFGSDIIANESTAFTIESNELSNEIMKGLAGATIDLDESAAPYPDSAVAAGGATRIAVWNSGDAAIVASAQGHKTVYIAFAINGIADAQTREALVLNALEWMRDNTPPITTDDAVTGWRNADVIVTLAAADDSSGVAKTMYRINDGIWQEGTIIALAESGEYAISYYSIDKAGNTEEIKQSAKIQIDKEKPAIEIASPQEKEYSYTANLTIEFSTNDVHSGIASSSADIDGIAVESGAGIDLHNYTLGKHILVVNAVDNANNSERASVEFKVIDDVKPESNAVVSSGTLGNNEWYVSNIEITITATDEKSGVQRIQYSTDRSTYSDYTAPLAISSEGIATIYYHAIDNAGNVEDAKQLVVKIDKTKPTILDNYASSGAWVNANQTIVLAPTDNLSGIAEVKYCEGAECIPQTLLAPSYELTYITDQDTIVRYATTDNAGNASDVGEFNVKLDKIKPITSDNAQTGWVNSDVIVALTATDNLSGVAKTNYSINGSALHEGNLITLTETGKYVINYYSTDNAENVEEAKRSATVQIDKILPIIAITSPEAKDYSYTVDFTVQYSASDEISGVAGASAEIDGTAVENAQSIELFGYAVGKHTFTANAADLAGNSKTEQVEFNVIDDVAPITGDNADKEWHNSNIIVILTATDEKSNVAAIHYVVNSKAEQTKECGTQTCTAEVIVDYEHNDNAIEYWAVDEYGNAEEHKQVSEIKLDKSAPEISDEYDGFWHKENFSINIASADPIVQGAPSGLADTWYELYIAGISQGAKKLSESPMPLIDYEDDSTRLVYWSIDVAGNRAEKTVEHIKLDKTAPTASDNSDTEWHRENISIALASNDPVVQGAPSGVADVYYIIYRDETAQEARSANANGMPIIDYEDNDNWIEYWPTDIAGNEGLHATRKEIKLDKTAPETANDYDNLWHKANFNVNLSASDAQVQGAPSGVAETYYKVYTDESPGAAKALSADGQPLIDYEDNDNWIEYWSADIAGNEEAHKFVREIKLDKTAPQVELSIAPQDKYYTTEPLPVVYSAIDPQVQGTPSNNLALNWAVDGIAVENPNVNPVACSHTLTLTATDLAGNFTSKGVDYEAILKLVGEAQLKITPETLNVNPGTLTAHAEFPLPYSAYSITGAYADYAAMEQLAGDNMKFGRQDIESALASRGLQLDTHFEVWGEFLHNGQTCKFEGSDDITAIEPDNGNRRNGR